METTQTSSHSPESGGKIDCERKHQVEKRLSRRVHPGNLFVKIERQDIENRVTSNQTFLVSS